MRTEILVWKSPSKPGWLSDGHATHRTRYAFEHDRQRDQQLMLAGWRVIRFTWRQLTQEPDRVAATLRGLLAQSQPN